MKRDTHTLPYTYLRIRPPAVREGGKEGPVEGRVHIFPFQLAVLPDGERRKKKCHSSRGCVWMARSRRDTKHEIKSSIGHGQICGQLSISPSIHTTYTTVRQDAYPADNIHLPALEVQQRVSVTIRASLSGRRTARRKTAAAPGLRCMTKPPLAHRPVAHGWTDGERYICRRPRFADASCWWCSASARKRKEEKRWLVLM